MAKSRLYICEEGKCEFFALGRNAMYAACQTMGIKADDQILTPAFDCDGSLQPFKVLGAKPIFFRSDPYTFEVDINDIRKRISRKTKLIHIINHFGIPQPWDEILRLRSETNIPILEDCAYSLFSAYKRRFLGTFGDISIFSLRKNLPLIDGGLLIINNSNYDYKMPRKKIPLFYSSETANLIAWLFGLDRGPNFIRLIAKKLTFYIEPPPPLYSEMNKGYPDWPFRDEIDDEFSCDYLRPMSKLARFQLKRFSPSLCQQIAQKKREYYTLLSEGLKGLKGIKILWPKLPEGVVPFCLSILIGSKRDYFLEALRKKYDVFAWPTLPGAVLNDLKDYPEAEILGRKALQLILPAEKVIRPAFRETVNRLIKEIRILAHGISLD